MSLAICPTCGRPRLLDAFAGEGGAGAGYMRAGFCVDAVDKVPDRKTSRGQHARLDKYPYDCARTKLICEDAVAYIADRGHEYHAIHASPTCTGYSRGTAAIPDRLKKYDRLIGVTREALRLTGRPYVIENVEDAHPEMRAQIRLCWTEFYEPGSVLDTDKTPLWMERHRLFESNVTLWPGPGCRHPENMQCAGSYGGARRDKYEAKYVRKGGYVPPSLDVLRALCGTPWMSEKGCRLSIPPVYAEHIGKQLLDHLMGLDALDSSKDPAGAL